MGLDMGSRTIGVAMSDEEGSMAFPLVTLTRKGTEADVSSLLELVDLHNVGTVVFGMPLHMSGEVGQSARRVKMFMEALRRRWTGRIEIWDERLSTTAAERVLLEADVSRKKRKQVVDKLAASVILQGYLAAHRPNHQMEGLNEEDGENEGI